MPRRPGPHLWRIDHERSQQVSENKSATIVNLCRKCGLEKHWSETRDRYYRGAQLVQDVTHAQGPVPPCPGREPAGLSPAGRQAWGRLVARCDVGGAPPSAAERERLRRGQFELGDRPSPEMRATVLALLTDWVDLGYPVDALRRLLNACCDRLDHGSAARWAAAASLAASADDAAPDADDRPGASRPSLGVQQASRAGWGHPSNEEPKPEDVTAEGAETSRSRANDEKDVTERGKPAPADIEGSVAVQPPKVVPIHVTGSVTQERDHMSVTERTESFTAEPPALNVCEHGDHPAPAGRRFCSDACAECDSTIVEDDDLSCANICGMRDD